MFHKTLTRTVMLATAAAFLGGSALAQDATDPTRDGLPGKAVFDQKCAMCHMHSEMMRARSMAEIRTYPAARIKAALTDGVMKMQGAGLSDEEKDQVSAYLGADTTVTKMTSTTTTTSSSSSSTTH